MGSTQFIQIGLPISEIFFIGLWNLYFDFFGYLHGVCQRSNTEYLNVSPWYDAKRIKTTPKLDRLLGYLCNQANFAHLSIGKSCWTH